MSCFLGSEFVLFQAAEAAARQGHEQSFNVTLELDAMTDMREDAERRVRNVFPRLGCGSIGANSGAARRALRRKPLQCWRKGGA